MNVLTTGKILSEHRPASRLAELYNSSLLDLLSSDPGELTLCARFVIYQFIDWSSEFYTPMESINPSHIFLKSGSNILLAALKMNKNTETLKAVIPNWTNGNNLLIDTNQGHPEYMNATNIKPGQWNSICFTVKVHTKYQVILNGETIIDSPVSFSPNSTKGSNLILLGYRQAFPSSTFGALTDVNIWNRTLTFSEVEQWGRCEMIHGGDYLDWNSATWNIIEGLHEEEVDKEEICREKESFLIIPKIHRSFAGSDKYCRALGGEMLVAKNDQILAEMIEAFESSSSPWSNFANIDQVFFMGFVRKENGVYVDINTSEKMRNTKFSSNTDFTLTSGNCAVYHIKYRVILSLNCAHDFRPVCKVPSMTSFHLQGVCKNSGIDRYYILQTPGSLLGYSKTKMAWSPENSRWEIVNLITNTVAATMNNSPDYPIGSHSWFFEDGSGCSETGKSWRKLSLHLPVPQPGTFCCDDGECINSVLVCDNFDNCDNGEDENNCSIIKKSVNYDSQAPPTLKLTESRQTRFFKTEIHGSTDILSINDFDEDESEMLVTFNLKLRWKDRQLKFNFLKKDDQNNSVKENEDFWKPKLSFSNVFKKEDIDQFNDRIFVQKSGKPVLSDSDDLNPKEIYSGSENWIFLVTIVKGRFVCLFDNNKFYPFGSSQTCNFSIFVTGSDNFLTNLVAENLSFSGHQAVGKYKINKGRLNTK